MIQEALVILACTHNSGCPQATNLYYESHPLTKETIIHRRNQVNRYLGPDLVLLSTVAIFAVRGRGTVRLNKYFSAQISNKDGNLVLFKYDF